MPSRRSLLGSFGVLLTAGCSQQSQADTESPADTSTTTTTTTATSTTTSDKLHIPSQLPWGESTTYDGTEVTPTDAWQQHSVLTLATPDTFGVQDFSGRQILFVTVDIDGSDPVPQPGDFTIDAAGERYIGWTHYEGFGAPYDIRPDERASAYDPTSHDRGGWIGFILPTELDADSPRLLVQFAGESEGATRWPLPDDLTQALNAPTPHIKLDTLELPDTVPASESFDVTLTATNHGKGPGIFRAAVNEAGPQYVGHAVRLSVPSGESRTTSVSIAGSSGTDADTMTIGVVTVRGSFERTVTLE